MRIDSRQRYRQRLMDMRIRIAGQSEHVAEAIREDLAPAGNSSAAPLHLADVAAESIDADAQVLAAERDLLDNIEAALVRIDQGSYGTCERCGREISEQRLDALPFAARCVLCAQEEDAKPSPDDEQQN